MLGAFALRSVSAAGGGVPLVPAQSEYRVSEDDIFKRLNRVYTAVNETVELDLNKFPPKVTTGEGLFGIEQDFLGGLSAEQIENLAHSMIANIANFRAHLERHAKGRDGGAAAALDVLDKAQEFQIIKDLFNNEKHGYPPKDGGYSGLSPRLEDVNRVMRLTTAPRKGAGVAVTLGPKGMRVMAHEGGGATVIITGKIVDHNGSHVGELRDVGLRALDACDQALRVAETS